jgi:aldehyde dehydrogenase
MSWLRVNLNRTKNYFKMSNIAQRPEFKAQYDNYIGGKFVAPVGGEYFENISPIDGKVYTKAARSTKADIDLALDAAHEAFKSR